MKTYRILRHPLYEAAAGLVGWRYPHAVGLNAVNESFRKDDFSRLLFAAQWAICYHGVTKDELETRLDNAAECWKVDRGDLALMVEALLDGEAP